LNSFWRQTIPAWAWFFLIFILCAIPGRDIPHISFLELLSFDKFIHASIFFILVFLFNRGLKSQTTYTNLKQKAKIVTVLSSILYGGLLEIMQGTFFQERTADIYDFIANTLGCLAGAFFFEKLNHRLNNLFTKH
jgi:VanZ family protein